ncbi:Meiosis arrest female protein 1-like protein [Armadillidium nasatum]|uniref:Meiosis arrest female protein 1-like protein n=1 Tax=Armadillidium nasatum TaxID=96803 RepID=A0A5N5T046_9CRUS|nr:Meiosis arrest female protein 1-like protein [Armadillidium nasatum]
MITLKAFPEAFEKTIGKPWDVTDYGICDIMDLLREIQETTVVLKNTEDGTLISIPKREQTAEEIERTRLFATEVVELLRHSPECKMQFNRFIPAYHHHFGRQCRLSDYGFSKLIELFEAIPDVLQILGEDEEGERILQLVEKERLRILGDQIFTLVKNSPNQMIGISALAAVFMHYYGYSLKPSNYDCKDFAELIGRLRNHVKIENVEEEEEAKVTLVDRSLIEDLWSKTREILWGQKNCSLKLNKFIELFVKKFTSSPDVKVLKKDLQEFLQIQGEGEEEEIKLVPLQIFARDLLILLNEAGGRMLLLNFESFYLNRFEVACRPANLGFPNLTALLQSFSDFVSIKGKRFKRIIVLNKDKVPQLPNLPPSIAKPKNSETTEKQRWNSFSSNSVPPPPTAQTHKTSQSQQYMKTKISSAPPTPPCDQKLYSKEIFFMPTMPINWSNVSSLPLTNQPSLNEGGDMHAGRAPVSIQTLEHFGKGMPPNPNELPFPECLTANGNNSDTFFSIHHNDGQSGNLESRTFSSPSKNFAKKRLAAQFEPNNH